MAYPGDSSLTREIQLRILSTFRQALNLSDENRRDEAIFSCDFILRLDAQFEPARALKRRLGEGDLLEIEDLREIAESASVEPSSGPSAYDGLLSAGDEPLPADGGLLSTGDEPLPADDGLLSTGDEPLPAGDEPLPADDELLSSDDESAEAEPTAAPEQTDELVVGDDLLSLDLGVGGDPGEESAAEDPSTEDEASGEVFDLELDRALSHLDEVVTDPGAEDADDLPTATPETGGATAVPSRAEAGERIVELLQEGQAGFDEQNYQQAIDAWSRIFLIDIDHAEANRLIERARQLKAEAERALDEVLHEGIAHLEAGEDQQARTAFERILQLQPNHLVAKEYLEELGEGSLGLDPAVAEAGISLDTPPTIRPASADIEPDDDEELPASEAISETVEGEELEEPPSKEPARAARRKGRRSFLLIGSAVLVLALAGGWYLLGNWQGIFPNSATDSVGGAGSSNADPFQRARKLQAAGKTEFAIKLLERKLPGDADYDEAQALIAQFRAADETSAEGAEEGLSADTTALLQDLGEQAQQAFSDRRYLKTEMILNRIAEIQPLTTDQEAMSVEVADRLEPIQKQITLIRQGDWESAVPQLWRLLEDERDDRDILRLLVDGYFNLGVRDLQRGRPEDATQKFQEALSLAPQDEEIERLIAFSQVYERRNQDLRYRIFIKYVPFR